MRENSLDSDRKAMADAYSKDKAALRKNLEGAPPYNSVKLSEDQERMMFLHPERILPGGVGDPGLATQELKSKMGPDKYKEWTWDWLKKLYGIERW